MRTATVCAAIMLAAATARADALDELMDASDLISMAETARGDAVLIMDQSDQTTWELGNESLAIARAEWDYAFQLYSYGSTSGTFDAAIGDCSAAAVGSYVLFMQIVTRER